MAYEPLLAPRLKNLSHYKESDRQYAYFTLLAIRCCVGTPRFRPNSIFVKARSFGRKGEAQLIDTPELTPGERLWAIYQHRVALVVLKALETRPGGIEDFAEDLGVALDWLQRQLHGQSPADLEVMLTWTLALRIEPPSMADVWEIVLAEMA